MQIIEGLPQQLRNNSLTDPLLTAPQSAHWLGLSVTSFYRRVADGTIPAPIKLGGMSRWPQSEILAVIDRLKAARAA